MTMDKEREAFEKWNIKSREFDNFYDSLFEAFQGGWQSRAAQEPTDEDVQHVANAIRYQLEKSSVRGSKIENAAKAAIAALRMKTPIEEKETNK